MAYIVENLQGIGPEQTKAFLQDVLGKLEKAPRKVLLIPPDISRLYSWGGKLTAMLYRMLADRAEVHILPALGTHMVMTRAEQISFFGEDIPENVFLVHRWRDGVVSLGDITGDEVEALSGGLARQSVPVEVDKALVEGGYDWICSIGQVVPHEVVGMANYTKNIMVGCGGSRMINFSHLLGVLYGTEKSMGNDFTPVRKLFDAAQEKYLCKLPLTYILTVTHTDETGNNRLLGLYAGKGRDAFEPAVALSQKTNITYVEKPVETCVVYLQPEEFRTSWIGNKAVYRTRQALKKGARLIILAPGFERFGEDMENDALIRKYGYCGSAEILQKMEQQADLQGNLSVVAHLAQGSSDGNFTIVYCTKPEHAEEIRSVGYEWADVDEIQQKYADLTPGWNRLEEEVYYIPNPALGLWKGE